MAMVPLSLLSRYAVDVDSTENNEDIDFNTLKSIGNAFRFAEKQACKLLDQLWTSFQAGCKH